MARAVERGAGMVDIDAFERGGEAVGIAFAPDLAVGDDVEAGALLRPDGEQRGVVLRLGARAQLLHDRAAHRLEAFQRFVNISFSSQGLRERDSVLHSEARARADREMRRAQRVAYQYHVS